MENNEFDGKRVTAFIIDYILISIVQAIAMGFFLIMPLIKGELDSAATEVIFIRQLLLTLCVFTLLVFKDIFPFCSIGKKIMKKKIVYKETGEDASCLIKIARNLFLYLGPIEMIIYLINKERLADIVTKTKVVDCE